LNEYETVLGMWEVAAVRARVAALAAEDPDLLRYGADEHRYAFGPTVPESRVAGFEARHGVRLPGKLSSLPSGGR
jgi:hypothetical protein